MDERKSLDLFFRISFAFDGLGYTLFGDKPMTAVCYYDPKGKSRSIYGFLDSTFYSLSPGYLRMYHGWKTLQKYKHLFPLKDYGLIQCKNFIDNDFAIALFINKKAILETVECHLEDFRKVLGHEITPEILLGRILTSDDVFGDVLKNHQGLIGTLLGFGRDNAWLFQRREEIDPCILKMRFSLKKLGMQTSNHEINRLNEKLQGFDPREVLDFNPLFLRLPGFVADLDTEKTKQLKIKYERQYRRIVSHYRKADFLEATLEQMTSGSY